MLKKYLTAIRKVIFKGFSDYPVNYGHVSFKHHPRSRATLIHDHIIDAAKETFSAFPEIHFIKGALRNLFDVEDKIVLQFKKLKRSLISSNYPTQLALAFQLQESITGLPGISPKLPRLTAGYVPSTDFTKIDGIYVTYAEGKKLKWFLDVTNEDDQVLPFQIPDTTTQNVPKKRTKPKKLDKPHADDAANG